MKGLKSPGKVEGHWEPKQASMMKLFCEIVNNLLFLPKNSIIDVWLGCKEACENNEIFKIKLRCRKSSWGCLTFFVFQIVLKSYCSLVKPFNFLSSCLDTFSFSLENGTSIKRIGFDSK